MYLLAFAAILLGARAETVSPPQNADVTLHSSKIREVLDAPTIHSYAIDRGIVGWYYTLPEAASVYELVLTFSLQGIANREGPPVFIDTGNLNVEWNRAERVWKGILQNRFNVRWQDASNLCELLPNISGLVLYPEQPCAGLADCHELIPLALTASSVLGALPVTPELRDQHSCLRSKAVVANLTSLRLLTKVQVHERLIEMYLSRCTKGDIWNGNVNETQNGGDYVTNTIYPSLDLAVSRGACLLNLTVGNNITSSSSKQAWPEETALFLRVVSAMEPLPLVWGWSDPEFDYVNVTSRAGAIVLCAFGTPNLSFWWLLSQRLRLKPMRLPSPRDSMRPLKANTTYITWQTNEGDTPRILASLFSGNWLDPQRGSVPISWSVDPVLGREFPALWNSIVATATENDAFVFGVSGGGYVRVDSLEPAITDINKAAGGNVQAYEGNVAQLIRELAPLNGAVVDVYNRANMEQMITYQRNCGGNISAFMMPVLQGTRKNGWLPDRTPAIETEIGYYMQSLNKSSPANDLAQRIRKAATTVKAPEALAGFINIYGGLKWINANPINYFELIKNTMDLLGDGFEAVGVQEMARLARAALPTQMDAIVV